MEASSRELEAEMHALQYLELRVKAPKSQTAFKWKPRKVDKWH